MFEEDSENFDVTVASVQQWSFLLNRVELFMVVDSLLYFEEEIWDLPNMKHKVFSVTLYSQDLLVSYSKQLEQNKNQQDLTTY